MKNVLIAEDDFIFLNLLISALENYKDRFKVLSAKNGKEAISILEKTQVSLLVTDIKMPEVDGLALLAHVNENYPLTPCFVMTAYETPEMRKKLPKDIRHFFRKPFPADKLGPEILKTIDQDRPEGSVHGISVSSFMMMIEMEKKTCILEITLPEGKRGLFYFEKGVLWSAVSEKQKGEAAALSFINRKRARFSFRPLPEKKVAKFEKMVLKDLVDKAAALREQTKQKLKAVARAKDLNLSGTYTTSEGDKGGQMTVSNISIEKMSMKFNFIPRITAGDKFSVEFILDDKPRSVVNKEVIAKEIKDLTVIAEFCSKEHYDRLGPYLHFNGLDKQSL
ncbi:MAG: response regulator [Deltaproteobacteria bacterium]|nr:response regulator [Deltaproteobacteria bacterium]